MKSRILAGAIGGLVGAAAKQLCEKIVPPRAPDRRPPPGVLAAKIVRSVNGRELTSSQEDDISLLIHWIFSVATSAAYAATQPPTTKVRLADGIGFGIVLWAGLHEFMLPLVGATPPLAELPLAEQMNEFTTHAIFGAAVETVRACLLRFD